jgi:hypothetical protein
MQLKQGSAVVVYFDDLDPNLPVLPYPPIKELQTALGLRVIDSEWDGAIYQ